MNVLFLTHRLPYAPNRGDRVRAYHLLKLLRPVANVTLVSLVHDDDEASQAGTMKGLAETVHVARVPRLANWVTGACSLASRRPLTHSLLASPEIPAILDRVVRARKPDIVLAYCSGVAQYALGPTLARFPLVVDMLDVDSAKWSAMSEKAGLPMKWIYARETRTLGAFERVLAERAVATVVVNEKEREALAAIAPGTRVDVIPNGVDYERLHPTEPPTESRDVVFCGVMNYAPNEEAAIWMAKVVWPLVLAHVPDARFKIVGSSPTARVQELGALPGIDVTGTVEDVRPYLWAAAIAAAPLQIARGVQNKVLEAVAAGLPVVVTPAVASGLPKAVMSACRVARSAEEFARETVSFLQMPAAERRAMSAGVDLAPLSWETRLRPFVSLFAEAAGAPQP